ncbi:hypothetical protein OPV22_023345 [Ensete ventricosum]|uniref:Uncharacterized protein n=1 Tax=Ensete ventricosum TaxID=4639 RepID=A0AAV8QRV5_ENSVE|nr:hypothetical protein OPV22_023345 [Ensete ventricosum]
MSILIPVSERARSCNPNSGDCYQKPCESISRCGSAESQNCIEVLRSHKFRIEVAPINQITSFSDLPAGQGLPDRLHCQGISSADFAIKTLAIRSSLFKFPPYVSPVTRLRAVNNIHSSSSQQNLQTRDGISFVTVYTIYNSSIRSDSSRMHDGSSELVTVANSSYRKAERSIAILNVFVDFIQNSAGLLHCLSRRKASRNIVVGSSRLEAPADGIYRAKIFLEEVLNVYSLKFMKASHMLGDKLALAWFEIPGDEVRHFQRLKEVIDVDVLEFL